jgi:hypothetical protein
MHLTSGIAALAAVTVFYPASTIAQTYTECNPLTSGKVQRPFYIQVVVQQTQLSEHPSASTSRPVSPTLSNLMAQ